MILVFLLYALFALVFIVEKMCFQYSSILFLVGSRMFVAGILMLVCYLFFKDKKMKFSKGIILKLCFLGAINIYLTNIFEAFALKYLYTYKTCLIYNLSPFISAIFSYFIFSEMLNWKKWLGLIIGFIGFIPLILAKSIDESQVESPFISWPELSMIMAVICSVYGWILLKQLVQKEDCHPLLANGTSMLTGGFLSLGHSYMMEDWNPIPISDWQYFLIFSSILLIVSNLICYNLYALLLTKYSATFLSFAGFSTPFFTAMLGWFFLNENILWQFYLSTAIIAFGLYLFSQEERKQEISLKAVS